ncbi:hypothetical protein EBB07_24275 [Paenibacillaceae bacterium]|nr:hypothetical protein EBB07_24275 [Paenibacillaceae bacterium]
MKKILLFFLVSALAVLVLSGFWIYSSKVYYPELPFADGSKKEVVTKLEQSDGELVQLAQDNEYYWLGFRGNQADGTKRVIEEMEQRGFTYDSIEGAGIFFDKDGRLIITGKMWSSRYIIYKVPADSFS